PKLDLFGRQSPFLDDHFGRRNGLEQIIGQRAQFLDIGFSRHGGGRAKRESRQNGSGKAFVHGNSPITEKVIYRLISPCPTTRGFDRNQKPSGRRKNVTNCLSESSGIRNQTRPPFYTIGLSGRFTR